MKYPRKRRLLFGVLISSWSFSFLSPVSLNHAPLDTSLQVHLAPLPSTATITHVIDGDSCLARFADGLTRGLRLIGINAPELTDEREDVRTRAFLAKRFAAYHLEGKKVKLEYDWNRTDKYGRVLAYVRAWAGELFNEQIVRQGFAYIFLLYPFRKDYQESFRRAQQEAIQRGRGLWAKAPPPQVDLSAVRNRAGEVVSVRFLCARAREGEYYVFLSPIRGELQVLIWKEREAGMPPVKQFRNKWIVLTGLLEKEGNKFKIYVLFQRGMIRVASD